MIIVDMEFSGLNPVKHGIFEIGAVDSENSQNTFFGECMIDGDDFSVKDALAVSGKTDGDVRDTNRQSQKELLQSFFKWVNEIENKILVCQNFDDAFFLKLKSDKYELEYPFGWRAFDLHTLSHMKYQEVKGEFETKNGNSVFGLSNTLRFVGMDDPRNKHNALEDAKLEAEVFSRLVYGKNLIEEFKEFEIPDYLIK